jgi:hypothetical protein
MTASKFSMLRLAVAIVCFTLLASCATRPSLSLSLCTVSAGVSSVTLAEARGISVILPSEASGPSYDLENYGPTWRGTKWAFDALLGNGGILQFTHGGRYCLLDNGEMKGKVFIGEWISHYGAYADVWHASTPNKISTVSVSIEPGGLTEDQALSILRSVVTTWEH